MSVTARHPAANLRVATDVVAGRRRFLLALWLIGLAATAAFGLWAAGPYLRGEFRRLEPWQVAAVCCGDAVAALWFLRFAGAHLVLGKPLVDEPAGPTARRTVTLFLVSMLGGLMLDMGVTVYLRHVEHRRYAASPQVTADVLEMTTNHASQGRNYTLDCAWRHPDTGQTHHATLRVHAMMPRKGYATGKSDGFPPEMPSDVVAALAEDRAPSRVPVRYDPSWPARTWLEGVPEDDNGLFFFSLAVHAAQAVAAALIALAAWGQAFGREGSGLVPWWLELSQAVPTAAQVVAIAFMGAVFRVFGY